MHRFVSLLGLSFLMTACGGGDATTPTAPSLIQPTGIWLGVFNAADTNTTRGVVTDNGLAYVAMSDSRYWHRTAAQASKHTATFSLSNDNDDALLLIEMVRQK